MSRKHAEVTAVLTWSAEKRRVWPRDSAVFRLPPITAGLCLSGHHLLEQHLRNIQQLYPKSIDKCVQHIVASSTHPLHMERLLTNN